MTTQTEEMTLLDVAEPIRHPAPAAHQAGTLSAGSPYAMMMTARAQGIPPEEIGKMMDLHQRWERWEAEKSYNAAFAAFKAEAVQIVRGREVTAGPLQGRRYAELHDVVDAVTPALSKHGLSASWKLTKDDKDWLKSPARSSTSGGTRNPSAWAASPIPVAPRTRSRPALVPRPIWSGTRSRPFAASPKAEMTTTGKAAQANVDPSSRLAAGSGNDLPEDWKIYLRDLAQTITQFVQAGKVSDALHAIAKDNLDADQRVYLESQLDSKVRSALKKDKK